MQLGPIGVFQWPTISSIEACSNKDSIWSNIIGSDVGFVSTGLYYQFTPHYLATLYIVVNNIERNLCAGLQSVHAKRYC